MRRWRFLASAAAICGPAAVAAAGQTLTEDQALGRLRAWADAADETVAKSVAAVPHANDARELVRRAQEIERAAVRLDQLHTIAATARERLRAARATTALTRAR